MSPARQDLGATRLPHDAGGVLLQRAINGQEPAAAAIARAGEQTIPEREMRARGFIEPDGLDTRAAATHRSTSGPGRSTRPAIYRPAPTSDLRPTLSKDSAPHQFPMALIARAAVPASRAQC